MLILGIDPATVKSGVALIEFNDLPAQFKYSSLVKTNWTKKYKELEYFDAVKQEIQNWGKFTHNLKKIKIYMEVPYLDEDHMNVKGYTSHVTAITLWKLALQMHGLKYETIAPSTWQSKIGIRTRGTGLTTKEQAKNITLQHFNIPYEIYKPWSFDQFDALGIAYHHVVKNPKTMKRIYELTHGKRRK